MLGFGDSAKPVDHVYSLMEQADLQQALLAELQVDQPVHLLAHDYGGSVAQELLARHHEQRANIASCVFLNSGAVPRKLPHAADPEAVAQPAGLAGRALVRA